jgi:hypothetical protein
MTPRQVVAWCLAHPDTALALAAALVALLRGLYAALSRLATPYPRLRAALEAVAALAPDVLRFAVMVARAVTGRAIPMPAVDARDAEIATLRARVAELAGDRATVAPPSGGAS